MRRARPAKLHRRTGCRPDLRAWLACLFAAMGLAASPASAALTCPGSKRIAIVADRDEARQVCRAADAAAGLFAELGLELPRETRVHLVDRMHGAVGDADELGRFDGRLHTVQVLNFTAARKAARRAVPGLGVAMNRALWRSYIVHELAHAAIHAGCDRSCPDRASHEYIAAIAQIASLPAPERKDVLRHHNGVAAFARQSEISEIYYALSPCRFAVKSYLHYRQPENGPAFVRRLLEQDSAAPPPEAGTGFPLRPLPAPDPGHVGARGN